jgi:hypothetical protein
MRGHLFVANHPYLARTDVEGRFQLEAVPPGTYELACWLPNWHVAKHELDAETTQITRLTFRPSVVKLRDVTLKPRERQTSTFTFSSADFER